MIDEYLNAYKQFQSLLGIGTPSENNVFGRASIEILTRISHRVTQLIQVFALMKKRKKLQQYVIFILVGVWVPDRPSFARLVTLYLEGSACSATVLVLSSVSYYLEIIQKL